MSREFIVQGNFGGYYDDDGHFVVCEEYGLTDADTDKYAIDVMNGNGYYNSDGMYAPYSTSEE